jgi:hypothetical protein
LTRLNKPKEDIFEMLPFIFSKSIQILI